MQSGTKLQKALQHIKNVVEIFRWTLVSYEYNHK